jgi:hypothetical protein
MDPGGQRFEIVTHSKEIAEDIDKSGLSENTRENSDGFHPFSNQVPAVVEVSSDFRNALNYGESLGWYGLYYYGVTT